ncbi:MAG: YicC/YloC family endoribonuclease [Thermodesulfobacteriota bacterium]
MLKSMTGYGSGECVFEGGRIVVEIKSVNHRYMDISCKLPKRFSSTESQIRKSVSGRFSRGRFEIIVQSGFGIEENEGRGLELNLPLAQEYYSVLKELKDRLHLSEDISLSMLTGIRDIIVVKDIEPNQEGGGKAFNEAFKNALNSLERMRESEGEVLYKDFLVRLNSVEKLIDSIRIMSPRVLVLYRDRLAKRVKELGEVFEVDPQRLKQEIAFLAERSDITEELVRIKSHLEQFGMIMEMDDPVGRKLDFLLQEINREVNTIASKANDADISQKVVEIKSELEKIREQIQNIE